MWRFMTVGNRQIESVCCDAGVFPCCDSLSPLEEGRLHILSSQRSPPGQSSEVALS